MKNSQYSVENSRKGGRYIKTPLAVKISLLRLVFQEGEPIKKVSQTLKIKYSTAKTLARQYKIGKQPIDWNQFADSQPMKELNLTELKRCGFVEISHLDIKAEFKDSQTELLNPHTSPLHKNGIQENHIHNQTSSKKIAIISRTLDSSLHIKVGSGVK